MSAIPEFNEYLITLFELQKPINREMTMEDIKYYVDNNCENISIGKLLEKEDYKKFYVDVLDYAAVIDFNMTMEHNPNLYSVKDIVLICKIIDRITLVLPPEDALIEDIYTDNKYINKIKKRYNRNDMLQNINIPIFNHKQFIHIMRLDTQEPNYLEDKSDPVE